MPEVNCYIPITVRITGRPSDAQLDELGETLVRALEARIACAEQTLIQGQSEGRLFGEAREAPDVTRFFDGMYELPAYDRGGRLRRVPVRSTADTPTPAELPLLSDFLDYAFFFTSDRYGRAAQDFIRAFYPQHRRFRARSFEHMFRLLLRDIRRHRRRTGRRAYVSEIVLVTHAIAAGRIFIPLTEGRPRRTFTPSDLAELQQEFRRGLHRRFREERREVVGALDESTRIVVRGCNVGQAQETLDALRLFFGGRPHVFAPTKFQHFRGIEIARSFAVLEDAFDFLIDQGYLPEDQRDRPDEEKRRYIRETFGDWMPSEGFITTREEVEWVETLRGGQLTDEQCRRLEEILIRPSEQGGVVPGIPTAGEFWGHSGPRDRSRLWQHDPELEALSAAELVAEARRLLDPYRAENAPRILRVLDALFSPRALGELIQAGLIDVNDPLGGLPDPSLYPHIFGAAPSLETLETDAAGYPSDPFEEVTLPREEITAEQRAEEARQLATVRGLAAASVPVGAPTEVPVERITFAEEDVEVITSTLLLHPAGEVADDQVIPARSPFEGRLVAIFPGWQAVRVHSTRYAISSDLSRAIGWGQFLFGARSFVILEGPFGQPGSRYFVLGTTHALRAPVPAPGSGFQIEGGGEVFGLAGRIHWETAFRDEEGRIYLFRALFTSDDRPMFPPNLELAREFYTQLALTPPERGAIPRELARTRVFGSIDRLIAGGDIETAARRLSELDAHAFALVSWETKAAYLQVLINAWTREPQEVAIVEIVKSIESRGLRSESDYVARRPVPGPSVYARSRLCRPEDGPPSIRCASPSRSELFAALGLVRQAGLYDQLFADLDSQIWSLLVVVGQRFGDPGPITFDFLVELLQQAGLVPRNLGDIARNIALGPMGPIISTDCLAELEEAARGFVRFLGGSLEAVRMLISEPEKVVEGIAQLVKLAAMVQLAQLGYPPAVEFVGNLLRQMAQQVVYGLKGAQLLGVTGDILRRIKWAIIWEVASWFVGVGEIRAILAGVGLTERVAAIARFIRVLRLFGRVADAERVVSKLDDLVRLLRRVSVLSREDDIVRLMAHLPEEDIARLGRALESADVSAADDMVQLAARSPELVAAAEHALRRAEALSALELRAGRLSDNLVQGYQRLASRSGFSNQELFNLMSEIPGDQAELFMRAVRAMPDVAFGPGVGGRSLGFFHNLASRPRSMQLLIDAGYDTFAALYRQSGYNIVRFEENLDALTEIARRLPSGQADVAFRRFLDRLRDEEPAALRELGDARSALRAAAGRPPIRSYTPAELDDIVRMTSDIRRIREMARQMDNSTAGSLFERWTNHYVFHEPVGSPRSRLSIGRAENPHLDLERDRLSDFFLDADGSLWDSKIYQSGGEVDVFQLSDYRKMEEAGFVLSGGQRRNVSSVNYIFSDRAAAEANRSLLHVQGGAEAWFIDDHGVLRHLN